MIQDAKPNLRSSGASDDPLIEVSGTNPQYAPGPSFSITYHANSWTRKLRTRKSPGAKSVNYDPQKVPISWPARHPPDPPAITNRGMDPITHWVDVDLDPEMAKLGLVIFMVGYGVLRLSVLASEKSARHPMARDPDLRQFRRPG